MTDAAGSTETDAEHDDAAQQAKARALSSPLRMRILRFCLHEARSNREIAAEFEMNPGTSLHHVRTLVETGFLRAEQGRPGKRGATEIPYRATGASWRTPVPGISTTLVQAFLDEVSGVDPDQVAIARLGLLLDADSERELNDRLVAVLTEFKDRGPDAGGRPISVMTVVHPEVRRTPGAVLRVE